MIESNTIRYAVVGIISAIIVFFVVMKSISYEMAYLMIEGELGYSNAIQLYWKVKGEKEFYTEPAQYMNWEKASSVNQVYIPLPLEPFDSLSVETDVPISIKRLNIEIPAKKILELQAIPLKEESGEVYNFPTPEIDEFYIENIQTPHRSIKKVNLVLYLILTAVFAFILSRVLKKRTVAEIEG